MDPLNSLLCSIHRNYKVPYNITKFVNSSSIESGSRKPEAMEYGAITGILVAFLLLLSFECKKSRGSLQSGLPKIFNVKNISRTLVLTIAVLVLPIIVLFLILASVYKVICSVIIRRKDKYFVGFLDSFDVFWNLEDDNTKSIINVLGVTESVSPYVIATNIKQKLKNIVLKDGIEKIFYRRSENFGFYYWRKYSMVDMDQYVEIVKFPNESESSSVRDLEYLMSALEDQCLPYGDEGLFKILITEQRVANHNEAKGDYGIIFRIHHSIGDGVALLQFLCQTLADNTDSCTVNMFSIPESCNHDTPSDLFYMIQKLLEIPVCFVDRILRSPDDNALHGPSLVGKKIFKWTESDENLLTMVKDIKENILQTNFTDVLLTALSSGLRKLLSEKIAPVPDDIAVILPVRFTKATQNDLRLKNDFSVTILDLPVRERVNMCEIKDRCRRLRKSADPLTNYYFLGLSCSILPKSILQPLLDSKQATMVFSNMPGPEILSLCGGNALKSLVFFIPNKGTTGLGVTALCYGGVLRFAAMADSALVSSSEDLGTILDGMVEEIIRLHQRHVK